METVDPTVQILGVVDQSLDKQDTPEKTLNIAKRARRQISIKIRTLAMLDLSAESEFSK